MGTRQPKLGLQGAPGRREGRVESPRSPVTPPRWWLRPWRSSPHAPETAGKAYSEAARPRRAGRQLPRAPAAPALPDPVPTARPLPSARGQPRDPYHRRFRAAAPGCSELQPPPLPSPGGRPASSSGTSRRRLRETRVPKSRSRRLLPAFQAAPDPPLPLPAGSHFRQATAELAEVRRAGNGRTWALASPGGGGGRDFPDSVRRAAEASGSAAELARVPEPRRRQRRGLWETRGESEGESEGEGEGGQPREWEERTRPAPPEPSHQGPTNAPRPLEKSTKGVRREFWNSPTVLERGGTHPLPAGPGKAKSKKKPISIEKAFLKELTIPSNVLEF